MDTSWCEADARMFAMLAMVIVMVMLVMMMAFSMTL